MKLLVARHGETTWNVEGRTLGHTPGELTDVGMQQAGILGERIAAARPDAIYAADLKRHKDTLQLAFKRYTAGVPVTYTDQLRERSFGELEGKLRKEVDWDEFWAATPQEELYGAESMEHFVTRIARFVTTLPELESDKTVVLLTSIGVLNRLRCLEQGDPYSSSFTDYPNAELIPFDAARIMTTTRALLQ